MTPKKGSKMLNVEGLETTFDSILGSGPSFEPPMEYLGPDDPHLRGPKSLYNRDPL